MAATGARHSTASTIVRVTSGNFLEMYDFFLFGLYAPTISKVFFPTMSLVFTLLVFGVGFLMRPIGAVVLGTYIDRVGRRQGLIVTLSIMAAGTALLAFVPGYATLGILAPILIVIGRLLQGFSAGVELGGVSVYLAEIAPPRRRGFFVSWQSASQQVAVIFGAMLGFAVNGLMAPADITAWGWRIPFFVGCLIVPFLFVVRRSLQETEVFLANRERPSIGAALASLGDNWRLVFGGMMLVVMTTVLFYFITIYTPSFGKALKLSDSTGLTITLCVGLSNLFWLPVMGALSDRIGRRPLLVGCALLALASAYPALAWLVASPSLERMLIVELWLSFLYGSYNGAMVVTLAEIMPASVRASGFSLAYSLATAIFGGFTPAASEKLINLTGDGASPAIWLAFAAVCGLAGTMILYRRIGRANFNAAGDPAALVKAI